MSWTVSANGSTATFSVSSGDTVTTHTKATSTLWPLRGANPIVQSGPTRVASLSTPDWLTTSNSQHILLMSVLSSGSRLTITSDTGEVYYAIVTGDIVVRIEDTPTRNTFPRRLYRVPLVGVA
jgi:hypothetical protein